MASIILRARKLPEEVAALVTSKKEFVAVPIVKTPPKGKYVRVRDGDEWDFKSHAFLMLPADFGSDRREYLMVHPRLEEFVQSKRQLRSAMKLLGLAFVVDMHGCPAFWALNLGDSGNWGTSARMIAEELKHDWGMVCADKSAYVLERPEDDLGEPMWPEGSVEYWLSKAFTDHLIDSEDHPEIKKLLGKK